MDYDTYTSPSASRNASAEMLRIWSPRHKFQTWRRIWLAVAEARQACGSPTGNDQIVASGALWWLGTPLRRQGLIVR
jgi:adenylosuccinate lyase